MRISNKWAALAILHLLVLTCLAVGVIFIALQLRHGTELAWSPAPAPPSETEIARLHLLSARIDVIQNNLANSDTVGFKRQRVNIEDGNPPKISECQLDMTQGALESTGQSLDLAIQGDGFFRVKLRPTVADGTGYTRNGTLRRNRNGELVMAIGEGYSLIPPIVLPSTATNIAVSQDGKVEYCVPGNPRVQVGGQIQLFRFVNPQALGKVDGMLVETTEAGPPVVGVPGEGSMGVVLQGFLENSNVDPQAEWAALLRAQQMQQFSNPVFQRALQKQKDHRSEPPSFADLPGN